MLDASEFELLDSENACTAVTGEQPCYDYTITQEAEKIIKYQIQTFDDDSSWFSCNINYSMTCKKND